MATATLVEMGLPTVMERGMREYGDLFVVAVQEAVVVMGYAMRGGIDELGTTRPKADPLDVLPSVVYDVMRRCQGLATFTVERAPIPETPHPARKEPGPRAQLIGILETFLDDCSYARWTGRGLTVDGRVRWNFAAVDTALDHIEELFDKALPRPWTTPDKERLALAERVHVLTAQLAAAVGHGTERPLKDEVVLAVPEPVGTA